MLHILLNAIFLDIFGSILGHLFALSLLELACMHVMQYHIYKSRSEIYPAAYNTHEKKLTFPTYVVSEG